MPRAHCFRSRSFAVRWDFCRASRMTRSPSATCATEEKPERRAAPARSFLDTVIEHVPAIHRRQADMRFPFRLVNRAPGILWHLARRGHWQDGLRHLSESYRRYHHHDHLSSLRNAGAEFHAEREIQTLGNGARLVVAKTLPIRHDDGEPQHILIVIEDVTERRRIEKRVAHLAITMH